MRTQIKILHIFCFILLIVLVLSACSPKPQQFTYVKDGNIYNANADGSSAIKITGAMGAVAVAAWLP